MPAKASTSDHVTFTGSSPFTGLRLTLGCAGQANWEVETILIWATSNRGPVMAHKIQSQRSTAISSPPIQGGQRNELTKRWSKTTVRFRDSTNCVAWT